MNNYKFKNKKKSHTRSESERRDKVTSLRSSEAELKKIQKNAKDAGLSVNNYLNTIGANGANNLTPATLVEIQNTINYACSVVEETAPEKVDEIQERVMKLWQKLM